MTQPFKPSPRRRPRSARAKLFGSGQLERAVHCAVIVAHPADEVIGAGCLISKLAEVSVLHITDGAPPDDETAQQWGFSDRQTYKEQRREETAAALALANVKQIIELHLENQTAAHCLADLTKKITGFLQQTGADIVVTHPYEGGHPDHDATAFATHTATRLMRSNGMRPPDLFEMALRPDDEGRGRCCDFLTSPNQETTTLVPDECSIELKQKMYELLATQRESLKASVLGPEKFRQPQKYDFTMPPHEGKLHYERLNCNVSSEQWHSLACEALKELFPQQSAAH